MRELLIEKYEKPSLIYCYGNNYTVKVWNNRVGDRHRNYKLPAVVSSLGPKYWFKDGYVYRMEYSVKITELYQEYYHHNMSEGYFVRLKLIHKEKDRYVYRAIRK